MATFDAYHILALIKYSYSTLDCTIDIHYLLSIESTYVICYIKCRRHTEKSLLIAKLNTKTQFGSLRICDV